MLNGRMIPHPIRIDLCGEDNSPQRVFQSSVYPSTSTFIGSVQFIQSVGTNSDSVSGIVHRILSVRVGPRHARLPHATSETNEDLISNQTNSFVQKENPCRNVCEQGLGNQAG